LFIQVVGLFAWVVQAWEPRCKNSVLSYLRFSQDITTVHKCVRQNL